MVEVEVLFGVSDSAGGGDDSHPKQFLVDAVPDGGLIAPGKSVPSDRCRHRSVLRSPGSSRRVGPPALETRAIAPPTPVPSSA